MSVLKMEDDNCVLKDREYLAFISYRHDDNKQKGRKWGTWLHQALETYEIPSDLIGEKNLRNEIIPDRIFPIFRDEEELPADADLQNSITNALANSRLLIVICSPNSVASTYVDDEIKYFKKIGRSNRIIALMIAGEPNVSIDSLKQEKGAQVESECFPLAIQYEVDENGELTSKRVEPIAADFRVVLDGKPEQGWTNIDDLRAYLKSIKKYNDKNIDEIVKNYQKQQQLGLLKVIAGVLGVPLGELTKRDQAYQLEIQRKKTKILRRWLSAVIFLSVIVFISGLYAFIQKSIAIDQRDKAENAYGQALMEKALHAFESKINNDGQVYGTHAIAKLKNSYQSKSSDYFSIAKLKGLMITQPGFKKKNILDTNDDFISIIEKSPSGSGIAAVSLDGKLYKWKIKSGEYVNIINSSFENATSIAYSPDGEMLASGSNDGNITLWSAKTGKKINSINSHNGTVHSISFSPNENILASSSSDFSIKLWDVITGDLIHTFYGHEGNVFDFVFSPDGNTIFSTGWDKSIIFWDVINKNIIKSIKLDYYGFGIRYSSSHNSLLIRSVDNSIRNIDVIAEQEISNYIIDKSVLSMELSSCDNYLLVGGTDSINIFDLNTNDKIITLRGENIGLAVNFESINNSIMSAHNGTVSIWKMPEGIKNSFINKQGVDVLTSIFIQDGKYIVTGGSDSIIRLWHAETHDQTYNFLDKGWVDNLVYTSDGVLASSGITLSKSIYNINPMIFNNKYYYNDNKISLWDINNQKFIGYLDGHRNDITSLDFSPIGNALASSDTDGNIIIWDVYNKKIINRLQYNNVYIKQLSYSHDGKILAVGYEDGQINLWSLEDFSLISILHAHKYGVEGLSFTPDNKLLVSADIDGIKIWDYKNNHLLRIIDDSSHEVLTFSISPDSKYIASGGIDNTVRIWSIIDGINLVTFNGHADNVMTVNYSPDGKYIISGGLDGIVRFWHIPENFDKINWNENAKVKEQDLGLELHGISLF